MKNFWALLLLLMLCHSLFSQRINYSSRVYDGITYMPIAGVNVYNLSSKDYAFTDEDGFFNIQLQSGDTLIFSKSIYRQFLVVVTQDEIDLKLNEYLLFYKAVLLKEVSVHSLNPSYEGFKRDISNIKLPDAYQKISGAELSSEEKANIVNAAKGPNVFRGTKMESPITLLYNMFSKKVKMKQLYNEMIEYEEEIDRVPSKYNREMVSEITGLKGDELLEFMVFCRFSYYDIIRWSEEDIIRAVNSKFAEYEYYKALQDE